MKTFSKVMSLIVMQWCGSMSVINKVYFRIIIEIIIKMKCVGKYVSKLNLPQYGMCTLCCAERD